jgi:hypothetical protein
MELLVIFVIIFAVYGAGWVWQTVSDIIQDGYRKQVHGQARAFGGHDLQKLRDLYLSFAGLCDGQMDDQRFFESPKVSFLHQGSRAILSIYECPDPTPEIHTQLTYAIPQGWPHRLEIFPQRAAGAEVNDIRVGDDEFNSLYRIKSDDEKFAREFLDAPVRQTVEDLRNLLGNGSIMISVNSARLMIRKLSVIATPDDLSVFAALSNRIFDRIHLFWQRSSGIEILDDDPQSPDDANPVCQVCGSVIPSDVRLYCRRCRMPHHKDCWEFNGRCSTYSCGEKRSMTKD